MHEEYFFVKIIAQTHNGVVEYRNVLRKLTMTSAMQFAMNDCFTTIPHCTHLLSIHIRRWELLTPTERKEVRFLEKQRRISEENLKGSKS
jgi:hypothetical protein